MKTYSTFRERLRELRGEMNQKEFGETIHASRGTISYYENGERKPDIDVVAEICKVYDVSPDWLLGFTENRVQEYQAVGNKLGLKDTTINHLIGREEQGDESYLETINLLISEADTKDMMSDIFDKSVVELIDKYLRLKKSDGKAFVPFLEKNSEIQASMLLEDMVLYEIQYALKRLRGWVLKNADWQAEENDDEKRGGIE